VAANTIRTVHLIFKTHLDLGFTELAEEVTTRFLSHYIPAAYTLSKELREAGGPERFVWTTGSWLIVKALERADADERARLEEAIAQGDIVWHGLPFTTHSELADASLFAHGIALARALDRRFGRETIAAKMTDVPGHTRGIVPVLAAAGIEFLHIGVNPAATSPDVPPVFVWRDVDGAEIIVMYHKGSYGDAMTVPGMDAAIQFAVTDDNLGPPRAADILANFDDARKRFPGAVVVASTLDAYARELRAIKGSLPVVTAEIGDSWIHGVGSDPTKVARYRELCRLRRRWIDQGVALEHEERLARASDCLLLVAEHSWGMDVKTHLADWGHYTAEEFAAARSLPNYKKMEESWAEKRDFIDQAVAALGDTPMQSDARAHLAAIVPESPHSRGYTAVTDRNAIIDAAHYRVRVDPELGAITHLENKLTGRVWATPVHTLGQFQYQTFSAADYRRFWRQYIVNKRATRIWSLPDNTKPGLQDEDAESRMWLPQAHALAFRRSASGVHIVVELGWSDPAIAGYGAPKLVTVEWMLPDSEPVLELTVQWFEKPACRMPEAFWLSFAPPHVEPRGWAMDKMGEWISPLDVTRNGNRKLHAVGTGVRYIHGDDRLEIETLDAPLVAPGRPSLLDFNNRQPAMRHGMHFNLYNNVWGTNFPMWYEDDARFRFRVRG
jgi:Domain of unknown function (DUF5054)